MFLAAFFFFFALAGQALALEINFNNVNITSRDLLTIPTGLYTAPCQTQCNQANVTINSCAEADAACLCEADVAVALTACEQCIFTEIINANFIPTDGRVGSQVLLTSYATACTNAQITHSAALTTLVVPPTWTGPQALHFNLQQTVPVVGFGAALGLFLVSFAVRID